MNSPFLLSSRIILHAKHARCRRPLARLSKSRCLHKPNFTSSGVSLIRHVSTTFVLYYLIEEGQLIWTNCSARRRHRLWPRSSQDHRLCGGGDRGGQWCEDLCIVYNINNIYIVIFFIFYIYIFIYWIEEVNDKKREDGEEEQQQRWVFIVTISKYCKYPQMFQSRAGRGRAQSFDEAAFISQLTLLDVQVLF